VEGRFDLKGDADAISSGEIKGVDGVAGVVGVHHVTPCYVPSGVT